MLFIGDDRSPFASALDVVGPEMTDFELRRTFLVGFIMLCIV